MNNNIKEKIKNAFEIAFSKAQNDNIEIIKLKGDGSTRNWYRLKSKNNSLIMVDHGITKDNCPELNSFIKIASHLENINIPVPKIYLYDLYYGIAILEDFGDLHLQSLILKNKKQDEIIKYYYMVIDILVNMSTKGLVGFDYSWAYQSTHYDKDLIIEKEYKYFVDAFLNIYSGIQINFSDLEDEFLLIADITLENVIYGLMHRDFQSRNIMISNNLPKIIDFQAARSGPIEYDLASLLIDPYVTLNNEICEKLLQYCFDKLSDRNKIDFYKTYKYCAINRNMQALGAFAYLSIKLKKKYFETYIPQAIKTLNANINILDINLPKLKKIIGKINS